MLALKRIYWTRHLMRLAMAAMGGLVDATVKNERAARLSLPSGETLETRAMGRDTTRAVSRR